MNIIIVGAGAIGSVVTVALARAGADVTALLRPDAVAESTSLRMQVAALGGAQQWAIVPIAATLSEEPDLVILCVPAHTLADACMVLAHLPAHIPVVALHGA
ncbi:MAG: NAD(P)-binding domain-containing protein, partial [Ktedonobacterales bacterium]|nr:NAD(P)-binding domain-containing protein [Ktedonobacterales bacterium]